MSKFTLELQQGLGQSPGRKWIWCVLSSTKRISDRQKRQNGQLHFDQRLELQHKWALNAPLIHSRPWRYINLFTYLLTY